MFGGLNVGPAACVLQKRRPELVPVLLPDPRKRGEEERGFGKNSLFEIAVFNS